MKAVLALSVLGLVPRLGYELEVARATAFHFMAVGQLLLTYPSRHTCTRPLHNPFSPGTACRLLVRTIHDRSDQEAASVGGGCDNHAEQQHLESCRPPPIDGDECA